MNPQTQNPPTDGQPGAIYQPAAGATPVQTAPAKKGGKVNATSTQNSLQISEIRDGIVIMSDGSFRAVVMCKAINFDLMSPQEREAVESSYQGFLNSLYFPIQIFIRSQKVDIRPYLEKLDKIRTEQDNMLLGLLMDDYIAYLADISQQANIMDKKFYVAMAFPDQESAKSSIKQSTSFFTGVVDLISPRKTTGVVINESVLENAKTELRNRVQAVLQGLSQCGVQALPLDTQELIELYYDAYNPDTATRQQLKDFNGLVTPIVTKGTGEASAQTQEND